MGLNKALPSRIVIAKWALATLAIAACSRLAMLVGSRWIDMNFDDAFIVLVYGRHLNETGSFFWNVQDGALDGFTSILDVLVKAAVLRLWDDPVHGSWLVTGAFHFACGVMATILMVRLAPPRRWRDWIAVALGACAAVSAVGLMDAAAFLLEGPMFVAAVLSSLLLLRTRRPLAFSASLVVMFLSRPEGMALAALLLFFWLRDREGEASTMRWLPVGIVPAAILTYEVWHLRTFGYWAPNTYYAKASASRWNEILDGLQYTEKYVVTAPGALTILAGLAVLATAPETKRLGILLAAAFGIVIVSGGDGYRCSRFFALASVLAPIAYAATVLTSTSRRAQIAGVVALSLLCLVNTNTIINRFPGAAIRRPSLADYYCDIEVARRLRVDFPGATLAQTDFQKLKFFSDETRVIDLTGLNNRHVAHEAIADHVVWGKHDLEYGAELRPDLWVLGFPDRRQMRLADSTSEDVFLRPAVFMHYFDTAFAEAPAEGLRQTLAANYSTASYSVCGGYFNFLVARQVSGVGAVTAR